MQRAGGIDNQCCCQHVRVPATIKMGIGITAEAGCRRTLMQLLPVTWLLCEGPVMLMRPGHMAVYKAFMPVAWRMCSMNTNMSVVWGPRRA